MCLYKPQHPYIHNSNLNVGGISDMSPMEIGDSIFYIIFLIKHMTLKALISHKV